MRILLLGKNGMLGQDLLKTFHKEDIFAFDRKELDLTDQDKVFEQLMTVQPEVVINATGYTNVDLAEKEEDSALKINGFAVGLLAKACREIDATFVHFSTDYVFDGAKKDGYREEDGTHPLNAYGRSKLLGEKLLMEEMEMINKDSPKEGKYFLIRTSWLYGHGGKNFVDTMLKLGEQKIKEGKKATPLMVVNDQHGKPTFTLDLCRQVSWLLKSREYPFGIYHITNENVTTWYDFAVEIFQLAHMKVPVVPCASEEFPRPAKRPKYSALINDQLPPLRGWKEALREYLDKKL